MAKAKGQTPTERAEKAEAARKSASSRLKNLNSKLEATKAAGQAAVRRAKAIAANQGTQQLAASAAGGALAGAGAALVQRYGGALGDTAGSYLNQEKFAGALIGVAGGALAVMADKRKGKGRATMLNLACGMAAGGAALASRPVVAGLLPAAVLPVPAAGLRYGAADPYARLYAMRQQAPRRVEGLRLGYDAAPAARAQAFTNRATGMLR